MFINDLLVFFACFSNGGEKQKRLKNQPFLLSNWSVFELVVSMQR